MADPLVAPQDLTARWEAAASQLRVTGAPAFGAAGAAVADLSPAVRVALDVARPHVLVELVVHAPDGHVAAADAACVRALVGEGAAERAFATVGSTNGPHEITPRPGARREQLLAHEEAFARVVLALDTAEDATLGTDVGTLAGLEAAALAAELTSTDVVDTTFAEELARYHAGWLADHDPKPLVALAARGDGAVDMMRAARDLLGRDDPLWPGLDQVVHDAISRTMARHGMRQLAEEGVADAIAFLKAEQATMAPAAPVAARAEAAGVRGARDEEPLEVEAPGHVIAWLAQGGSHLHVTARASDAGGAWVRAFDRDRRLLLGLSPLVASGGQSTALVLLPPASRAERLIVDLTDAPASPRPSLVRVALCSAIALGRRAARLERLGRDAGDAWLECAEAWDQAGDDRRVAASRERTAAPGAPVSALISDEVIDDIT